MSRQAVRSALPAPFRDCAAILACPATGEPLVADECEFVGPQRRYPVEDGIPHLFVPVDDAIAEGDVTELVKAFYEETPFPNYADDETPEGLVAKARANLLLSAIDAQLPDRAVVLEAGCGTGQLTNFLGLSPQRRVFGGDICLNSLGLANGFRRRHAIANAAFLQMNLFRPPFRDDSFDLVICNGVLHHTGDARAGFAALLRKVKPGGFILVGLYNRWARLPTLWRRWAFARFGARLGSAAHLLDRRLATGRLNEGRRQAWFRDQYQHPHETRHSIDEVLGWFEAEAVDFVASLPPADGSGFAGEIQLFAPQPRGTRAGRAAVEAKMLLGGGRYGGVFAMVGQKRARTIAARTTLEGSGLTH
jgi:SAM-dependent methyltransferase